LKGYSKIRSVIDGMEEVVCLLHEFK